MVPNAPLQVLPYCSAPHLGSPFHSRPALGLAVLNLSEPNSFCNPSLDDSLPLVHPNFCCQWSRMVVYGACFNKNPRLHRFLGLLYTLSHSSAPTRVCLRLLATPRHDPLPTLIEQSVFLSPRTPGGWGLLKIVCVPPPPFTAWSLRLWQPPPKCAPPHPLGL